MKLAIGFSAAVLLIGAASVYAQPYGFPPQPIPPGPVPGMQAPPMPGPAPVRPGFAGPGGPDAQQAMQDRMAANPMMQASNVLKEGIDKLMAFLGQEDSPNKLQVAAFLDRDIAPYFDFPYMAQWVAGPAYAEMTDDERKALAARLESSFLSALTGYMAEYKGQGVRLLRPKMGPRGSVDVNVAVLRPGSYPSKMKFRMYNSEDGWKVYDVVANSRSAAAYYRVRFQRSAAQGPAYRR